MVKFYGMRAIVALIGASFFLARPLLREPARTAHVAVHFRSKAEGNQIADVHEKWTCQTCWTKDEVYSNFTFMKKWTCCGPRMKFTQISRS